MGDGRGGRGLKAALAASRATGLWRDGSLRQPVNQECLLNPSPTLTRVKHVGLDVHAKTVAVATADDSGDLRSHGTVPAHSHAYADTISAGGRWVPDGAGSESLQLPGGQSHDGRLWDVLSLLRHAMRQAAPGEDTVWFSVLVDVHGNGRHRKVDLWARIGPGDHGEPVLTLMRTDED